MKARISRKFFCLLLAVVMVCTLLPISALADGPSGSIESAGITQNAVSVELKDVTFKTSVQVKLYSGDTPLTTATLKGVNPGSYDFLTCCIATETADEYWPLTDWTPKDDVVPDKAVLVVDGSKLAEKTFTLNADAWAALPGTYSGSIESVVITHANEVLKNAVSVELKDVTFKTSVQVKLYSGDTPLTTATLKGVNPGSYDFLTCCIATETADEYWPLTDWTPKDDVVPTKAVLFVDGHKLDEETFTLNDEDWANLPGTAFPYSGSINGAVITQNAVSVELQNVNFESSVQVKLYSGDTPLTTATLKGVNPGSYDFLTCCIATETADEYWPLTDWTPKDDVVPTKAVLFVDGHKLDEETFTLNDEDWANLPGTVPPSYTVTYTDGVSGEEVFADKSYTVKYNEATPAFQGDLTKYPGWKFKAWTPDLADTVTEDVTYTATWEPKGANTIIYWGNGGTRSKYSVGDTFWSEYTDAAEIKVRGNGFLSFALDEYAFNGWNTMADGTGDSYKSGDMYKFTAAHDLDKANLYAQWEHVACDKHLEDVKVITAPTCTEKGLKLCRCTVCGDEYEVEIPALGHDHGGRWTWNREEHWKKCLRCGAIIDCEEHTYGDWKPVVDNKGKDTDREERSCTVCGFTQYAQIIHIGGSTVTKPTGEQNPNTGAQVPSLLPALAVLAGAAVVLRKRK